MGWYHPAPDLSDKAKAVFAELVSSCSSEAAGVVECLNTIAENGGEQATDAFLADCAFAMRDFCQRVVNALTPPVEEPGIKAECHSDDHCVEVKFDAARWFQQANSQDIIDLIDDDWGGDDSSDSVAMYMADYDEKVAGMFKYLEVCNNRCMGAAPSSQDLDNIGFECHVDEVSAKAWLMLHMPALWERLPDAYREERI